MTALSIEPHDVSSQGGSVTLPGAPSFPISRQAAGPQTTDGHNPSAVMVPNKEEAHRAAKKVEELQLTNGPNPRRSGLSHNARARAGGDLRRMHIETVERVNTRAAQFAPKAMGKLAPTLQPKPDAKPAPVAAATSAPQPTVIGLGPNSPAARRAMDMGLRMMTSVIGDTLIPGMGTAVASAFPHPKPGAGPRPPVEESVLTAMAPMPRSKYKPMGYSLG